MKEAKTLVAEKRYNDAHHTLFDALAREPFSVELHQNLGSVMAMKGEYKAAVESFEQVLSVDPHYSHAHYNLALMMFRQNDFDRAYEYLVQAERWRPRSWMIEELFGDVLAEQGKIAHAIERYNRAILLNPSPRVYNALGKLYSRLYQSEKAIQSFAKSLSINPDQIEVWSSIAKIHSTHKSGIHIPGKAHSFTRELHYADAECFTVPSPALESVTILCQSFYADCEQFSRIRFQVITGSDELDCVLRLTISHREHSPHINREIMATFEHVNNNSWLEFRFEPVRSIKNQHMVLCLSQVQGSPATPLRLVVDPCATYRDKNIEFNNILLPCSLNFTIK